MRGNKMRAGRPRKSSVLPGQDPSKVHTSAAAIHLKSTWQRKDPGIGSHEVIFPAKAEHNGV